MVEEKVRGRSMIPIPPCMRSRILWCIAEAERIKGSPPNLSEIIVVFHMNLTGVLNAALIALTQNMYREDLFYADKEFVNYSFYGRDGTLEREQFELFSEKFKRLHTGYMLDKYMHFVAKPETPVLNLKQLMSLLKSKD